MTRSPPLPSPVADHAVDGVVVETRRRRFTVALDDIHGNRVIVPIKGRTLTPVCGDRVALAIDAQKEAAILSIHPRHNLFYRSDAVRQKLIAANVTQIIIVVAPDIAVDEMLLNRWIIAALATSCRCVIAVNKMDLPGFDALVERMCPYQNLGATIVKLAALHNADALLPFARDEQSVLIGQSGMGKSTIINALIPDAHAPTQEVSEVLDGGRHTTSAATLYPLEKSGSGSIIDIPGMKMFGLAHLSSEALTRAFVDIAPFAGACRFRDCRHLNEPDCAVQAAMNEGKIHPKRLQLFHEILKEFGKK
ncbi:MAG: ribosome small subunit-dependent GTPase A [Burkholderiales bacterium]|jgi:ribosome biogenesis GTPase|nr:ribosome small subunit-dependent GTPase A [Burkholderiales bacterium]